MCPSFKNSLKPVWALWKNKEMFLRKKKSVVCLHFHDKTWQTVQDHWSTRAEHLGVCARARVCAHVRAFGWFLYSVYPVSQGLRLSKFQWWGGMARHWCQTRPQRLWKAYKVTELYVLAPAKHSHSEQRPLLFLACGPLRVKCVESLVPINYFLTPDQE